MEAVAISPQQILLKTPRWVSIEEYYRLEEKSFEKNEYHDGQILPRMAGGLLSHNTIASRAITQIEMFVHFNNLDFGVSNSDTKLRIEAFNKIVYPDAVVICCEPEFYLGRGDTITNPIALVEVQSKSTEKFDSSTKFDWYKSLPSFKEYVIIYRKEKKVRVWTKQADDSWQKKDYEGENDMAILHHIGGCPIALSWLYKVKK